MPVCAAASFFAETEHAQALGKLKQAEPAFDAEAFVTDMTQFVIPEVVEAFWRNDLPTLRQWCTEGVRACVRLCASLRVHKGSGRVGGGCPGA
jgi:predicted lipid-binding transport protein (Tim44 family)